MSEKENDIAGLDLLDRRILLHLDTNARQSYSQIAKRLRQGRDRITYRVHRLLERGIIRKFVTVINPNPLGETLYKTYIKLVNSEENIRKVTAILRAEQNVFWVAELDGRWDYFYSFRARTPEDFYQFDSKLRSRLSQLILDIQVFTLVQTDIFSRNYLAPAPMSHIVFAHPQVPYELNELEHRILKEIAVNARIELRELADRSGASPDSVAYRLDKLERAGVVAGYRPALDMAKLNMTFFKVMVYLRDYSAKRLAEFYAHCQENAHVTFYIRQIGSCNVELQIEARSYWHLSEILRSLKTQFAKILQHLEIVVIGTEDYLWG